MKRSDETFRSLLTTLVPPAVFIAVLAMQIRFFKPTSGRQGAVDFKSLMPGFLRSVIQNFENYTATGDDEQVVVVGKEREEEKKNKAEEEEEGEGGRTQVLEGSGVEAAADGTEEQRREGDNGGKSTFVWCYYFCCRVDMFDERDFGPIVKRLGKLTSMCLNILSLSLSFCLPSLSLCVCASLMCLSLLSLCLSLPPFFSLSLSFSLPLSLSDEQAPSPLIQPAPPDTTGASSGAGPGAEPEPEPSPSTKKKTSPSLKRQSTYSYLPPTPSQTFLLRCYRLFSYLFNKTRSLLLYLGYLTWRFLQLHLYRLIMLFLFACSISQISVLYWLLLVGVVLLVPFPYFQRLTLPLVTAYLGMVTLAKMVYQFPVIMEDTLKFPNGSRHCEHYPVSLL